MLLDNFILNSKGLNLGVHFSKSFPSISGSSFFSTFFYFEIFKSFYLSDLLCIDYLYPKARFQILTLLSDNRGKRLILDRKTSFSIQSISPFFPSALWLEREIFDSMGSFFINIKIYVVFLRLWFSLFPLRKDFPLMVILKLFILPFIKPSVLGSKLYTNAKVYK